MTFRMRVRKSSALPPLKEEEYESKVYSTDWEPTFFETESGEAAVVVTDSDDSDLEDAVVRHHGDVVVGVNGYLTAGWPFTFVQNHINSILSSPDEKTVHLRFRDCQYDSHQVEAKRLELTKKLKRQTAEAEKYASKEASCEKEKNKFQRISKEYASKVEKAKVDLNFMEHMLATYTSKAKQSRTDFERAQKNKRRADKRVSETEQALKELLKSSNHKTEAPSQDVASPDNNKKRRRVSLEDDWEDACNNDWFPPEDDEPCFGPVDDSLDSNEKPPKKKAALPEDWEDEQPCFDAGLDPDDDSLDSNEKPPKKKSARTESSTQLCPITREELTDPVTNVVCGHTYSTQGLKALVRQCKSRNRRCPCPIAGCNNRNLKRADCF